MRNLRRANFSVFFVRVLFVIGAVLSLSLPRVAFSDDANLSVKLDQLAAAFQSYLEKTDEVLTIAANAIKESGLSGPGARRALTDLCNNWPRCQIYCATLNAGGTMTAIVPDKYQSYVGRDRSAIQHYSDVLRLKKPMISKPFKPLDGGDYAVSYAEPVFSKKGDFMGIVNAAVDPLHHIDDVVKPVLGPDTSDVWLVDTDGQLLYSLYHGSIGDNYLITPSYVTGSNMSDIIDQIVAKPSGSAYLKLPPTGRSDSSARQCIWKTVTFHDQQRRLVIVGGRLGN